MTKPCVLFRVDASSEMGMGHLMRCRAVAEAVVDCGGRAVFAMVSPLDAASDMMASIPAQLLRLHGPANSEADLAELLLKMNQLLPIYTVVDGYHFSDAYLQAVSQAGPLAVLWDAANHEQVSANVIIDASPSPPTAAYAKIAAKAILLTGPSYSLIRRDIRKAASEMHLPLSQRNQLLVTFGGSDPCNLSMALLPELVKRLPKEVYVNLLVGPAYPHVQALKDLASQLSPDSRLILHIHPPSIAPLFCAAGLVVSAAGGTIGELVALSLPVLSVVVARNQIAAIKDGPYPCLDGRKQHAAAEIAARAAELWIDLPERERMSQRLLGLVDSQGALRVAQTLLSTHFKERNYS
jgi:UDP-2,4-diacetamido-2,4,6-trideoxy-beta-L-altropyranose hydrolase